MEHVFFFVYQYSVLAFILKFLFPFIPLKVQSALPSLAIGLTSSTNASLTITLVPGKAARGMRWRWRRWSPPPTRRTATRGRGAPRLLWPRPSRGSYCQRGIRRGS